MCHPSLRLRRLVLSECSMTDISALWASLPRKHTCRFPRFREKRRTFRLHLELRRTLHWLSISYSAKLRQITLKNACIRQASCRRYWIFSWWPSWIQAWQVLREISTPIVCGSADIPCNRGNSFCCCVDSNQTYVSWINVSLSLCGIDRTILSKVSQHQDA